MDPLIFIRIDKEGILDWTGSCDLSKTEKEEVVKLLELKNTNINTNIHKNIQLSSGKQFDVIIGK